MVESRGDGGTLKSGSRLARTSARAGFAGLAALAAAQVYLGRLAGGEPANVGQALLYGVAAWIVWVLAVPLILALERRFDFAPARRLRSIAVHGALFVACHVAATVLAIGSGYFLFSSERPSFRTLLDYVVASSRVSLSILVYAAIVGLSRAERLWEELKARELEASRAETLAARARLEALASRLQPHFLFNALHAIGALVDLDPPRARQMIAELGDLLRSLLTDEERVAVPLARELELLRRYLAIEQIRFSDRLEVEIVAEPAAERLLVPRLLLQPLVENALRHGLAEQNGGKVHIAAEARDGRLRLRVWNDGRPLGSETSDGIGLSTTRERVTAWAADGRLTVRNRDDGGVEALVELPSRLAGEAR
jgi:hypothetical protein